MKQGRASRDVKESAYRKPTSRAISFEAATNLGIQQIYIGNKKYSGASKELYKGKGFEAPTAACKNHAKGSQGKY